MGANVRTSLADGNGVATCGESMNKKIIAISGITLALTMGLVALVVTVAGWFDTHRVVFHSPVEIGLFRPVRVEERKPEVGEIIRIIETIPAPQDLKDDIDKYIYEVFGIEHYRMAIAVSKCEGYYHPADGFNTNLNGTIDVGKMRINSVHFKTPGCSLLDVATPKGNIDCAYRVWDRSDGEEGNKKGSFDPWVGYKNGCAITKYE